MAATFAIQLDRLGISSSTIQRPKEITYFSYDEKHQFRLDGSSIRYYYPPPLGVDLSKGFSTFEKLDDTPDEHLDSLLKTIAAHEQETGGKTSAELITWRGLMTKIMSVPYSSRDSFELNATKFEGTIFIEENHAYKLASWEKQRHRGGRPGQPSQELMSFWGYKFETLCLLHDTWHRVSRDFIENRENQTVNNHAQYCSVVQTSIGSTSIVMGGEVDAVWDMKPEDKSQPINWVELKTSAEIQSQRDSLAFERKLMKFWIQSSLLGVPKIIVGFRSPKGILQRLEEIDTASIPDRVTRTGRATWNGNICINFAASFLDFLKTTITEGVWRIRRQENSTAVEVFRIEESGHSKIISDEFLRWRRELAARGY